MKYRHGSLPILLVSLFLLSGFRPFNDDSRNLVEAMESNFQAFFQVELYKLIQFEKNGNIRETEVFLIYNYGNDSARGIWRILPSDSFSGATLLSLQGPDINPPKLYLKEDNSKSGDWVSGAARRQNFGSTTWNLEDILDDDKEDWNNTRGTSTEVNGIYSNLINQSYEDPILRRESVYQRRSVYLSDDDNVLVQLDYFDRSGKLFKRLLGKNHQNLGSEENPRIRARRLVMDHVQREVLTVMTLTHYDYDLELEPRFFSPEFIESWDVQADQNLKDRLSPVAPKD